MALVLHHRALERPSSDVQSLRTVGTSLPRFGANPLRLHPVVGACDPQMYVCLPHQLILPVAHRHAQPTSLVGLRLLPIHLLRVEEALDPSARSAFHPTQSPI
jgi:hypothetical protein